MANWYDKRATYTEASETIVVGRPAFVASFYVFNGLVPQARAAFNAWLELLPPKTEVWYSHGETKRYLKLTPKAVDKVLDALSPTSIKKKYKWYMAKSVRPDAVDECHGFSFETFATVAGSYIYVTFPLDYVATQGAEAVVRWFCDWCERFEFTNGGAGFGYEMAWFDEMEQPVGPLMLTTGLRHHGVRVWERTHARSRGQTMQSLDTAAWLTFVDAASIKLLEEGAIEAIDPGVTRIPCGSGVVLQAGPEPDACDTNRRNSAYKLLKSVNDAIIPLRPTEWYLRGWGADRLHGQETDQDRENRWFSRMDDNT